MGAKKGVITPLLGLRESSQGWRVNGAEGEEDGIQKYLEDPLTPGFKSPFLLGSCTQVSLESQTAYFLSVCLLLALPAFSSPCLPGVIGEAWVPGASSVASLASQTGLWGQS